MDGRGLKRSWVWCAILLAMSCGSQVWAQQLLLSRSLSGSRFQYIVHEGDSIASIGSHFGVDIGVLAHDNGLERGERLMPDSVLWVDNRHIVPADLNDGLLINVPQRMLFVLSKGKPTAAYPVAVGRPGWRTPRGSFTVVELRKDPVWRVPPSIQAEMAAEGKVVRTRVPPGPHNPLGKFWIGLSLAGIGIHGTIAPLSIYHSRTHGCIRMNPDDVAALYPTVELGTPGKIIYAPVLMARLDDGRIFVEADPDIYGLDHDASIELRALAESADFGNIVSWVLVDKALERRDGLAHEVTVRRISGWDVLPLKVRGLSPQLGGVDLSAAGTCSG
jgi:L,D-transpeptidase ErfK/SrfK